MTLTQFPELPIRGRLDSHDLAAISKLGQFCSLHVASVQRPDDSCDAICDLDLEKYSVAGEQYILDVEIFSP